MNYNLYLYNKNSSLLRTVLLGPKILKLLQSLPLLQRMPLYCGHESVLVLVLPIAESSVGL